MGRKTARSMSATPEKMADVNLENLRLKKDFLSYLKSVNRSDETIKVYDSDLNIFFCWVVDNASNKFFVDMSKRDIVSFQNYILEAGCSPARVRHLKAALSSLSNYISNILDDEYPNFRPIIKKIENPVNETVREKTVLTKEQVDLCLNYLVEHKEFKKACFFALAAYSGRRKSELARFKVSYFDDKNIIFGSLYKTPEKIKTKGRGKNGKPLTCYTLAKQFKPYLDMWIEERERLGIESEWLFPDKKDPDKPISVSTMNSYANSFSRILGVPFYMHALRHFMTSELARANLPDSAIQMLIGWDSADMVNVYKDIDADEEFGKWFSNGEIVAQKQSGLSDL